MADVKQGGDTLPPGCGLWGGWLLASLIGSTLGWFIAWRLSFVVPGYLVTLVIGAVMGLFLGGAQSLILQGHLNTTRWWLLLTLLGWAIGFTAGASVAQSLGFTGAPFGMMVGLFVGIFLGILQWLYLKAKVTQAWIWIPASLFAWTISLLYYQPGISWIGTMYGMLSGIVTGIVLLWLLYRPVEN